MRKIDVNIPEIDQIHIQIFSRFHCVLWPALLLIDQADMIVSFVPALPDGRAAISSGVERELQHAHEASKEVYVIWTARQAPSVFVTQTASKVFAGVDEAMKFFQTRYTPEEICTTPDEVQ